MAKAPKQLTHCDRVLALVEKNGMSQTGAAVAAGLDRSILAKAKANGGKLQLDSLQAFAGLFKVPLGELLGDVPAGEAAGLVASAGADHMLVSFDQLVLSDLNPRKTIDDASIDNMADSIRAQGVLQNLVVRPPVKPADAAADRYLVVAGERRYRGIAKLVELDQWDRKAKNIPVRVKILNDAEHLALALLENLQREDVNPMEEAEAFAKLQAIDGKKWAPAMIAKHIGMTARHVQLRLALTKTSPAVQKALREGKINLAMARTLTMVPPSKQARYVSGDKEFATAEQLRNEITYNMTPTSKAKFDVSASGAKIVTDPDTGKSWFADRDEFQQLQKKAAKKIAADLKKEWAWVETDSNFFASMYEKEKSEDRKKAGAFVELDYRGEITVHTGLIKAKSSRAKQKQADRERHQAVQQSRLLGQRLTTDLQTAAMTSPRLAYLLHLFERLDDRSGMYNGVPKKVVTSIETLGCILPYVEEAPYVTGAVTMKKDADAAALWRALDANVNETDLALAIAMCLTSEIDASHPRDEEIPLFREICATAGVTFPEGPFEEKDDDAGDDDDSDQLDIEDVAAEAAQ